MSVQITDEMIERGALALFQREPNFGACRQMSESVLRCVFPGSDVESEPLPMPTWDEIERELIKDWRYRLWRRVDNLKVRR